MVWWWWCGAPPCRAAGHTSPSFTQMPSLETETSNSRQCHCRTVRRQHSASRFETKTNYMADRRATSSAEHGDSEEEGSTAVKWPSRLHRGACISRGVSSLRGTMQAWQTCSWLRIRSPPASKGCFVTYSPNRIARRPKGSYFLRPVRHNMKPLPTKTTRIRADRGARCGGLRRAAVGCGGLRRAAASCGEEYAQADFFLGRLD